MWVRGSGEGGPSPRPPGGGPGPAPGTAPPGRPGGPPAGGRGSAVGGGSLWSYLRSGTGVGWGRARRGFDWAAPHRTRLSRAHPADWLTRDGSTGGTLRISLTWRMHTGGVPATGPGLTGALRGLFTPGAPGPVPAHGPALVSVDLDLACLYELTDGAKGVVQPLGGLHGDLARPPYVTLGADSRFPAPSGETLYINLDKRHEFRRLLVFVYNYDATPVFGRVNATLMFHLPDGHQFAIELDENAPHARSCAVALIENRGTHLTVRREAVYVCGFQSDLDRLYGWGMQWARGYKEPR
ncbi:Tellurium resistance [Streptomyces gamaensis]|uniref:Tellurium resistance n=1 Tax=Streptomyces gamaensis TaxID=1763542 RepID=A0ABW0Z8X8_9ACTN